MYKFERFDVAMTPEHTLQFSAYINDYYNPFTSERTLAVEVTAIPKPSLCPVGTGLTRPGLVYSKKWLDPEHCKVDFYRVCEKLDNLSRYAQPTGILG
jgi:hypothetical protein